MSDEGEIHVVVEDENDATESSTSRIEALHRQADADRAKTARLNLQTAHLRREADLRSVDAAMLTAKTELQAAESQYERARDLGDTSDEKEAVRRMTAAEVRRANLEQQAAMLQRTPVSSGDQFEDHLSQFTDRTANWMRQHRDLVADPRSNAKLVGCHHLALGEGLVPDTDEYFNFVERKMNLKGGDGGRRNGAGSGRHGSSDINPNDVNTHVQERGVFLTKGERERANDGSIVWNFGEHRGKPIGNTEYARRKAAMIAEGRYNKLG